MARKQKKAARGLLAQARDNQAQMVAIRHKFHRRPELSYEENKTAATCAGLVKKLGYRVQTGFARTGVIADIGSGSPLVAIRADMDALPIQTTLHTAYASCVKNKMHACGHDAHMSMVLEAARLIAVQHEAGALPPGTVRIIFQPAEEVADSEGKTGARRMVEEGVVENAIAVIAQHGMPDIPCGQVSILDGPVMAASAPFEITINGTGGHIAEPERTVDTIYLASQLRVKVAEALREQFPDAGVLIGFGTFTGDTNAVNILPKQVTLRGSIRSFSDQRQLQLKEILEKACRDACRSYPQNWTLRFLGNTPVTENDPAIAAVMRQSAVQLLGHEAILETKPRFTAEDFAFFKTAAKTAFMLLGTGMKERPTQLHTADYDVPDDALPIGASVLAQTAIALLSKGGG